ncbi:hypothetical protein [Amycolatopsis pigmentata]|uniref:Lasso RiPP family leader peptide-containing protein n=1 Tax=Amycolatopsis pigmentata TaxID=450801 RepID=A0ABW5FTZ6_9PSEU
MNLYDLQELPTGQAEAPQAQEASTGEWTWTVSVGGHTSTFFQ